MARACSASGARRSLRMSSVASFNHFSAALIIATGTMPSLAPAASAHQEATSTATGAHLSSLRATSADARSDIARVSRVNGVISWSR